MADSTTADVSKMKVVDLRKELKSRGLSYSGDKAELVARMQAALSQDVVQDEQGAAGLTLSSDEIDSDGVLEEDEKGQQLLYDSAVESSTEELALAELPPPPPAIVPANSTDEEKPQRKLKRKLTMDATAKEKVSNSKTGENKEKVAKKIVLNRANSISVKAPSEDNQKTEEKHSVSVIAPSKNIQKSEETHAKPDSSVNSNSVKVAPNMDTKTRLELRAKRFGLPVMKTDAERKEARMQRFGQNSARKSGALGNAPTEDMDKLKKRAQRFGQSVSKFMTEIENKEKLEKRKAKFATVK